jgi:transposase
VYDQILTPPPEQRTIRRRTRRDPKPHFKADRSRQLDVIAGCPEAHVEEEHLARSVWKVVAQLDLTAVESSYSSLGRHGYHPRRQLAVWVYASLVGLHQATKLARALKTDLALRLLSGGYAISRSRLNDFRQKHGELFQRAIEQTVAMAREQGLLPLYELAVDSMRLRAHASTKAVRTLARSKQRLEELGKADVASLSPEAHEEHETKVKKHAAAVAQCETEGRASLVTTNPLAALMKFPSGAGLPGHRVTVTAAGVQERFAVSVLIDASPTDHGKLGPAVEETRRVLARIGAADVSLQIAADAGYCSREDLLYAERVRPSADLLVECIDDDGTNGKYFGRERFTIHQDQHATCPAGRTMTGPSPHHGGRLKWTGSGCETCPLKSQCTPGLTRSFTADMELERARAAMRARLAAPGGRQRYNQRIATIEPVFASIEESMGYRRASSRNSKTIVAEVLLKILAHNVSRLIAARRLARVRCWLYHDGRLFPLESEFRASL